MDSSVEQLLIGVASNVLTEIITRTAVDDPEVSQSAADAAIDAALSSLAGVPAISPALGGEHLRHFLSSQEVRHIVRQIYASDGNAATISSIREEFHALWAIRIKSNKSIRTEVDRLFNSIIALCENALENAIAAGDLVALDARNERRHVFLQDSLENVQCTLEILSNTARFDLNAIDDFGVRYRQQLVEREGVITPPTLDTALSFPIDDLYVPARLTPVRDSEDPPSLYTEFSSTLYKSVVLGNPGSGKSTLAKKLATDIATDQITLAGMDKGTVPFFVVLRDYGSHKRDEPCSIVDFITLTSNARYQLPPPKGAVQYLLATNRAIVIFDGLDELLDTSYRAEISGDVESFSTLFPATPLLVTSREVGYHQAPLSAERFTTWRLAEFDDDDVHQYAEKWFAVDANITAKDANQQADSFITDSAAVADLRSNALLLSLMCNLYKGSGYIPRNRPDVYEACAEMLFDRWDRLRHVDVGLTIESLLRPAMQHLAYWIYQDPDLQSGVTEKALIAEASDYLLGRRFDTREEAELEARRFIEFCRGRAWVFTDTGTTSSGDRLYQFTHGTFLEFFAAGHLVRTNPGSEELLGVLQPHIEAKEWDVVSQLAFQLLEQNVDGAANSLLKSIVTLPDKLSEVEYSNSIDFGVRSLAFLVPSPAVTREVTHAALNVAMMWAQRRPNPLSDEEEHWHGADRQSTPVTSLQYLLTANPENLGPIEAALIDGLETYLASDLQGRHAAELAMNLQLGAGPSSLAEKIKDYFLSNESARLASIGENDVGVATDLVLVGLMTVGQFIQLHGLERFLTHRLYWQFPGSGRVPLSHVLLAGAFWLDEFGLNRSDSLDGLGQVGAIAGLQDPPWYEAMPVSGPSLWAFDIYHRSGNADTSKLITLDDLDAGQRFAIAALSAAAVEEAVKTRGGTEPRQAVAAVLEGQDEDYPLWNAVGPILSGRLGIVPMSEAISAIDQLELGADANRLLRGWLDQTVSLVSFDHDETDSS